MKNWLLFRRIPITTTDLGNHILGNVFYQHFWFSVIFDLNHNANIFVSYSEYSGDVNELELGDEVEYTVLRRGTKISAEDVKKIQKGTVPAWVIKPGLLQGKVIRPLRNIDPQQTDYNGLIQVIHQGMISSLNCYNQIL